MTVNPDPWAKTDTEVLVDGVVRIPLPIPLDSCPAVNVYLLHSDTGLVLIDAGWALVEARDELARRLKAIGEDVRDVTRVLVTHAHRDHYPLAMELRQRYGTEVSLGADEARNLESLRTLEQTSAFGPEQVERLRTAGASDMATAMWASTTGSPNVEHWADPDRWLENGSLVELGPTALEVVATPGHTRGHVTFRDETRNLLFAGDHLLTDRRPTIGYERHPHDSPMATYVESLQLIRSLPDMQVLPGHGPVGVSSHERADELLVELTAYADARATLLHDAPLTAREVADFMHQHETGAGVETLALGDAVAHVLDTSTALQMLEESGAVASDEDASGVRRYVRTGHAL